MMGEELNCSQVTDQGLLGDRKFAVVDPATGKVGGARTPQVGQLLRVPGRLRPAPAGRGEDPQRPDYPA